MDTTPWFYQTSIILSSENWNVNKPNKYNKWYLLLSTRMEHLKPDSKLLIGIKLTEVSAGLGNGLSSDRWYT